MCGIIGICRPRERYQNLGKDLTTALKNLEYRGYDSVGIATVSNGHLTILKAQGKVDEIASRLKFDKVIGNLGLGHTRWATHGPPNDVNAHPHSDCKMEVSVVHNGIIRNFLDLKKELVSKGHQFRSDTDTEVIAHLIEDNVRQATDFYRGFKNAVKRLEGSYAIATIYKHEPEKIFFAKNESPLIVGIGKDGNYLASDIPALLKFTRRVIPLKDGEVGWISPFGIHIEELGTGNLVDWRKRVIIVEWKPEMARKGGYPHFMIKEIHEQPIAVRSTYEGLISDNKAMLAGEYLVGANKIFIAASGTSFHAALVLKYFIEQLSRIPVYAFISSEYMLPSQLVNNNDVIIAISQSGETIDTLKAVREFKKRGARVVSITNVLGSALDRESDLTVPTRAGPEIGVAATKTFLTQILAGEVIAVNTAYIKGLLNESERASYMSELGRASSIVSESITSSERWVKKVSQTIKNKHSVYFLGRMLGLPLAMEAALKLKEISYIHAEAYPAGESKHGPIALIEKDFPVFFVATSDAIDEIQGNISEMNARGALTYALATRKYDKLEVARELIILPETSRLLEPFSLTPPLQLLAYYTAVALGRDPDRPRNLAKTVTVE